MGPSQRSRCRIAILRTLAGLVMCCSAPGVLGQGCLRGESQKIVADDQYGFQELGHTMAIDGDYLILGSIKDLSFAGTAYVYRWRDDQWQFEIELAAPDGEAGDYFGSSVAVDGTIAVIGAKNDSGQWGETGSAYVFDLTTHQMVRKLLPDDYNRGAYFGCSVDVCGNVAVIGAWGDSTYRARAGSAYLFDITTGELLYRLQQPNPGRDDSFGYAVGINETVAVITATGDPGTANSNGAAYVFDIATGTQLWKLLPDDADSGSKFGWSAAMDSATIAVGFFTVNDSTGAVYLYDAQTGDKTHKLVPDDAEDHDFFGWSVGVDGGTVVAGSYGEDDMGYMAGAAYAFDATTGEQLSKLIATDGAGNDNAGRGVAVGGTTVVMGAPTADNRVFDSGSIYVFNLVGPNLRIRPPVCPDGGPVTIEWSCLQPRDRVALLYSPSLEPFVIPGNGTCAGLLLHLSRERLQIITSLLWSDELGRGSIYTALPSGVCGGYMQLVDLNSCETSNTVLIR